MNYTANMQLFQPILWTSLILMPSPTPSATDHHISGHFRTLGLAKASNLQPDPPDHGRHCNLGDVAAPGLGMLSRCPAGVLDLLPCGVPVGRALLRQQAHGQGGGVDHPNALVQEVVHVFNQRAVT